MRHGAICRLTLEDGAKLIGVFVRLRDSGVWERVLETLIDEPDFEWLMIDVSHIHPTRQEPRAAIRI